jgi:hypothetical protein
MCSGLVAAWLTELEVIKSILSYLSACFLGGANKWEKYGKKIPFKFQFVESSYSFHANFACTSARVGGEFVHN